MQKPFIEQYRPLVLGDVVGNQQIVQRLQYFVENGNLPNMLFTSPPGMGKTTICHCIGRQMLGEHYKRAFIELNASDERNITDIREKVKTFAQLQITLPEGRHKLIFLDECDSMTPQAQMTLRRIVEDYGDSTRFLLACNMVSKVIEPLQSRCCVITLQPPTVADIVARLTQICKRASITYTDEALRLLAELADGDVRNAVNSLQTASVALGRELTAQGVRDTLDFISVDKVGEILTQARKSFREGWATLAGLTAEGYSPEEIVGAFYRHGLDTANGMADLARARYLKAVAQAHARVAAGMTNPVQLARLLAQLVSE